MLADQCFEGIAFVPAVTKVSRKILFLATVLINSDILMCVMIGHLMDSHLYPVINSDLATGAELYQLGVIISHLFLD